jgi:hypothetical protein
MSAAIVEFLGRNPNWCLENRELRSEIHTIDWKRISWKFYIIGKIDFGRFNFHIYPYFLIYRCVQPKKDTHIENPR